MTGRDWFDGPEGDRVRRLIDELPDVAVDYTGYQVSPAPDFATDAPTGRTGGRALSVPLRRGTARRLGITQPTEVVMTIHPDLIARHRSFTAALEETAWSMSQVLRDAVRRAFGGQS